MHRFAIFALAFATAFWTPISWALAQRTFVSTTGNDASPCTLTLPCRAFSAAVALTNDGGEVIVLDSGGYGSALVLKSISLIAPPGVYGGITVLSAPGIHIGAAGASVKLRGLTFNGQGIGSAIYAEFASEVFIDNCVFVGTPKAVDTYTSGLISISDSVFTNNGGVAWISPGSDSLTLDHVRVERGPGTAIGFAGKGQLTIRDSSFSGGIGGFVQLNAHIDAKPRVDILSTTFVDSGGPGLLFTANDTSSITVNIRDSVISHTTAGVTFSASAPALVNASMVGNLVADNLYGGVIATSDGVTLIMTGNSLPRNATGIINTGAVVLSSGNNVTEGNATPVSGTLGAAQAN